MKLHQEKGTTLIEVLLSIFILSIILVSVMNFFPHMGSMNKQNENKTQAISLAKKVLIDEWQTEAIANELTKYSKNKIRPVHPQYDFSGEKDGYFEYKRKEKLTAFDVEVKIKKDSDLSSQPSQANIVHIKVLNDKGGIISETYGYIIYSLGGA